MTVLPSASGEIVVKDNKVVRFVTHIGEKDTTYTFHYGAEVPAVTPPPASDITK